jgi:hypothetical protein
MGSPDRMDSQELRVQLEIEETPDLAVPMGNQE